MTTNQKKKILQRIVSIEGELEELRAVRKELLTNGYASASMSSGSGSKSYTMQDAGKISDAISELVDELNGLRAVLGNSSSKLQTSLIYTVYS